MLEPAVAELKGVVKRYGEQKALDEVDFYVRAGEVLALLGPNGAGKTTMIRLLLGLISPTEGTVGVFGRNPKLSETRTRIGAMLQIGKVPETLRVAEHIDLFSSYYPSPLPMSETIGIAGLNGLEKRLFGELSGGQKQRVLFGLAICGNPDLLFLDEPTVGLDVEARRALWRQIQELAARGKTMFLTTHYLEEADALATRIAVINKGRIIAQGTPEKIKSKAFGKRIRCITTLPLESVREIPGVDNATMDRGAVQIQTWQAEAVIEAAPDGCSRDYSDHFCAQRLSPARSGRRSPRVSPQGQAADQLAQAVHRVHAGLRVIGPELAAEAWSEADPLIDRERQALRLAAEGLTSGDIAQRLQLSEGTVRNYLSEAISKLGAGNRVEAARLARNKGWF